MMETKIPTLIGIPLLLIGLISGVFLVNNSRRFFSRASSEINAQNVTISNTTHNSFTISWTTQAETSGYVKWGDREDKLDNIAFSNDSNKTVAHLVRINNLNPTKKYIYQIYSNGIQQTTENAYGTITTGKNIAPQQISVIASGKILDRNGNPVNKAHVYLTVDGGNTLSDTTKIDGTWLVTVSKMRSTDLSNHLKITDETILNLFIDAGPKGTASVKVKTKLANPVPNITLGDNFDFSENERFIEDNIPEASLNLPGADVQSTFDFIFN